jgi:Zn-dependent protease with chaperone function
VVAVGVELRPLVELDGVLDRDGVQAEQLAEHLDLVRARTGDVEPEELVALAQLGDAVVIDALQNLHGARAYSRGDSVRGVTLPVSAYKLEGISPRAYQHPADRAATAALGQVPYLDQVVRKLIELGYERALRAVSLGSSVRLGQEQLPHIWVLHRQVVNSLDLAAVPDLYLTQFPMANAMTIGVGKPIVVLNSELVTLLDADGQRAVLAHEAAHVHSDHVLYQTALLILLRLSANLPILAGLPLMPIRYALLEWFRAAELSCDRAAALLTRDPQAVCRTLMVLSAGAAAEQLNLDAFIKQGWTTRSRAPGSSGSRACSRTSRSPIRCRSSACASCSTGCARATTTGSSAATT